MSNDNSNIAGAILVFTGIHDMQAQEPVKFLGLIVFLIGGLIIFHSYKSRLHLFFKKYWSW